MGALLTRVLTTYRPPKVTVCTSFRACCRNMAGALVMASSTMAGSKRTTPVSWSTSAPALARMPRASGHMNSIPICSRIVSDAWWMDSTSSALSSSMGLKGFSWIFHGSCVKDSVFRRVRDAPRRRRPSAFIAGSPPL